MAGRKGVTFPTVTPTGSMFIFGLDTSATPALRNVKFLVSTDFINLKLDADQFNMNQFTEVAFVEDTASGLSVSSNRVTLTANKTYVITANFRLNGAIAASSMGIAIRDYTNSVNLGRDCFLISMDNPTDDSQQGSLFFIIKPTIDISIGFRVISVSSSNQGIFVGNSYGAIYSI